MTVISPLDRLQAAIEKLERLKAESTSGPWNKADGEFYGIVWTQETEDDPGDPSGQMPIQTQFEVAHTARSCDGDLIVTLHRTIDVQLNFLRPAAQRAELAVPTKLPGMIARVFQHQLALAAAILGGEQ